MTLRAVLLDVDGTLVDSNDAHARAWSDALESHGHRVPVSAIRPLMGMGGDKIVPYLTGLPSEEEPARKILEDRKRIFLERYLPSLRAFPRVRELVERIRREGLVVVVASSASEEELVPLLKLAAVTDLLHDRTSSDDAEKSKPDPDIVQAALASAGVSPGEALLVGDTPYDVEAGRRAGIPVVALRCGGSPEERLAGAAEIYDDPAELLARYETSLLFA